MPYIIIIRLKHSNARGLMTLHMWCSSSSSSWHGHRPNHGLVTNESTSICRQLCRNGGSGWLRLRLRLRLRLPFYTQPALMTKANGNSSKSHERAQKVAIKIEWVAKLPCSALMGASTPKSESDPRPSPALTWNVWDELTNAVTSQRPHGKCVCVELL